MTLTTGARIGNYEIRELLGAGGMGEVYRAHDVRLDRAVAIKALPATLGRDPDRLARFEREARLLASVHHPNIAAIHGIEDVGGAPYLVLEFVEGETLSQRLARGALTAGETLAICGQVAAAIEAAHERGVVHRDLKPANVMLTPSGAAKVLDFGLAKGGVAESSPAIPLSMSPTMAVGETAAGVILGTAPYMSPEQARGRAVDRRADVWALGCLLYECLTGRPAFAGETASDVVARILEREPEWTALPAAVPARLRDLVRRCLTKNPEDRPRDIGDLRREMAGIATELSNPSGLGSIVAAALPSLAVLYFENLAKDPESDYFCSGITEDILTDLSKIKGLRVASRNAVGRYRGGPADIQKIAAELGVGAVLEGSVRRAGDRIRLTAQLVSADGFHLWAERYDRTLQDVFAVQEEIASSIAAALRVALTPAETESLARNRPNNARAYDLYLKGREQYGLYTPESLRQALELFEEAITADPGYALAYAGVADAYGQLTQWDPEHSTAEDLRKGLEAARKAIALDPQLPEAHKAEALVLRYSGDLAGSIQALRRAVKAAPRFTPALINIGVHAYGTGNIAETERMLRRAIAADPQEAFATIWLASLLDSTGRKEESRALWDGVLTMTSAVFYVTMVHLARILDHLERQDARAAREELAKARSAGAEPASLRAVEAALAMRAGDLDEARRLYEATESIPGVALGGIMLLTEVALGLGLRERAASLWSQPSLQSLSPVLLRLQPSLHALLDLPPFAPRRSSLTLVWPLEAPMIDPFRFSLFREVRIESGRAEASDLHSSPPVSSTGA